jgi:hypothetical protein
MGKATTPREHRLAAALYKAMRNNEVNSDRTMDWALRALRLQRTCIEAVQLLDQGRTKLAREVLVLAASNGGGRRDGREG